MSSGLCRALKDIHNNEDQNINRELIQSIVHCFRIKSSINVVAQSVVEKIMSQHLAHYMQQTNNEKFKIRPDMTVMIRNFNYPIPNEILSTPQRQNKNRVNIFFKRFFFIKFNSTSMCFPVYLDQGHSKIDEDRLSTI